MLLKSFFIFGMAILVMFYGYCFYLSINPRVNSAYLLYYIDKILSSPHVDSFNYKLGEKVAVSYGSSHDYVGKGWSTFKAATCSINRDAYLLFSIDHQPTTDLELTVKAQGFIHPRHPRQAAAVYVNNIFIGKWEFLSGEAIEKRLTIPKEILIKNDLLIITIISEDRISPYKLGLSDDKRKLGICLDWLQINSIGK